MNTLDEIYSGLKQSYEETAGLALNDGGDMAIRFYALAAQLESLWAQSDYVNRQCFYKTASGANLDLHAAMRGLSRKAARKSSGSISFYRQSATTVDTAIPLGTRCMTYAGIEFETTQAGVIQAGSVSCTVSAAAVEAGASGNVPARSVVYMELAPTGITVCLNGSAFTSGSDAESDEELRARIEESYGSIFPVGNADYYKNVALNIEGVSDVRVVPRSGGRGTVSVYVTDKNGIPAASLVSSVQTAMAARKEICVDVTVSAPTAVSVNVAADISATNIANEATVQDAVITAVRNYFTPYNMGKNVLRSELLQLITSVDGVASCNLTSPAQDISISAGQLPVKGTISIEV